MEKRFGTVMFVDRRQQLAASSGSLSVWISAAVGCLLIASTFAGCGSAAKTRIDVTRAPSIAIVDTDVARLIVDETRCTSTQVGPDQVQADSVIPGVARLQDAQRPTDCSRSSNVRDAIRQLQAAIAQGLTEQNRRLVDSTDAPAIHMTYEFERTSTVSFARELEDEGENDTCRSRCGTRRCNQYSLSASVSATAHLEGPVAPDGAPQSAGLVASETPSPGDQRMIFCSESQASDAHRQYWDAASWDAAEREAVERLAQAVSEQFSPYREAVRFRFQKIGNNEANDQGIDHAKEEQWGSAAADFEAAMATAVAPEDMIEAQYNAGLAYMFKGELDTALDILLASAGAGQGGNTDELITEIQRQIRDSAILESLQP